MNRLIVGANSGLGSSLLEYFLEECVGDTLISVSRSGVDEGHSNHKDYILRENTHEGICLFCEKLKNEIGMIDSLVFLPSDWGDDSAVNFKRFSEFNSIGPMYYFNLIDVMRQNGLVSEDTALVSIGSISENIDVPKNNIAYKISKSLQGNVARMYALAEGFRSTNLVCGSLGDQGVAVQDVANTILYLERLSSSSRAPLIELYGLCDIRK